MPERRERFTWNEFPTLAPYEGVDDVFGNIRFLLSRSTQPNFSQRVFRTQAINTEKEIVINKNGLVFQFPLGHLTLIIPVNNWVFFRLKAIPLPFIKIV